MNESCKKKMVVVESGRLIKNFMNTLEFSHTCENGTEETFEFGALCTHLMDKCRKIYKCKERDCGAKGMSKDELKTHLAETCGSVVLTCLTCEDTYKRMDAKEHDCIKVLKAKLEKSRQDNEEQRKKLDEAIKKVGDQDQAIKKATEEKDKKIIEQ